MRRFTRGTFAFLFASMIVSQLFAQNQPVPIPLPQQVLPGDAKPNTNRTENGQITLPESRESRERLKAVMDYLERTNIPWPVVCSATQDLLNARSDSFYRVKDAKGNETGTVVSIKTKVNEILATFPKEGRATYEQEYGSVAKELLRKAIENDYDTAALSLVSQRYFHTKAGGQATLLLATLNLESGYYPEAAYAFRRLLTRPDADDFVTPQVLVRSIVAYRRLGDPKLSDEAGQLEEKLAAKFPRDGIKIGANVLNFEQLKAELARDASRVVPTVTSSYIAHRMGTPTHTGSSAGGTPFLDAIKEVPMIYRRSGMFKEGADWVNQQLDHAYSFVDAAREQVIIPSTHPITAKNLIVYRGYEGVYALCTQEGASINGVTYPLGGLVWITTMAGSPQALVSHEDRATPQGWWDNYWKRSQPQILAENALLGSLSHDGKFVYAIDDLAIMPQPANPQMQPNFQPQQQPMVVNASGVQGMIRYNRLYAIDIETGKRTWMLGGHEKKTLTDEEEEDSTDTAALTEGGYFLGPPLNVNGKLYVLMERRNKIKLLCLDINSGARNPVLEWVQNIGETATSLRTDYSRRLQPAYLSYADGVLVCPTNCGAVVGVDLNSRSLLWARFYGSAPDPKAVPQGGIFPGGRFPQRGGMPLDPNMMNMQTNTDRWRSSTPMIQGGKVIFTAYDSDLIQCLDLMTGESLWASPREKDDLYVGNVVDGKVLVVAKKSIRAFDLGGDGKGNKKLAWDKVGISTPCGHGTTTTEGLYYVPMIGNPDDPGSKQPQVWAVDARTGVVKSKTSFRKNQDDTVDPRRELGNLVFQEGSLYSVSPVSVKTFPLIELKRQQMSLRLKTNPNDPDGLTARGELSLDNGDLKEAIADFKKAMANQPVAATLNNIQNKLYIAYTEILRNKFEDGEPFLTEYEKLCDIATDTDDPSEKNRLLDEKLRRRGLYLVILARGREKQGRLTDAYHAYRDYATLDGGRQLVSVPNEGNVLYRPDVWARGRIENMMRTSASAEGKKALDELINTQYRTIEATADVVKLREFTTIFGLYFKSGREARFRLADLLVSSATEADQREAQTLLMQLWAIAAEPEDKAKAMDRLAQLMIRRGMLEDAVGLYTQMATDYGDIIVRDGKTAQEIYGELITDKRLLPYLERSGPPPASKYKVETITQPGARNLVQSFQIRPTGELFPYYRRFQLVMELAQPNDGSWILRVVDPDTGTDRCKFTGLSSIPTVNYNPTNPQSASSLRLGQAVGHLLLLNLGHTSYCFDLAEKREVWRQSLLGKNANTTNPQITAEQDQDIIIRYDDGWQMRLGRSAVLLQSYAAMMTREGLKVVDPTTGRDLWSLNQVSTKVPVHLFGDENYLFVVDNRGTTVYRASDGTKVENIDDVSEYFVKPSNVSIFGRKLLIQEKTDDAGLSLRLYDPITGKDEWKKSYKAKSYKMRTTSERIVGIYTETGEYDLFDGLTGKQISAGRVDPNQNQPQSPLLKFQSVLAIVDTNQVFLVINYADNTRPPFYGNLPMLNTQRVNGAIHALDMNGKKLWSNLGILQNQQLILDRFQELPVLVAASMSFDASASFWQFQIAVLDKKTGLIKHNYSYSQNGGEFTSLLFDAKNRVFDFWRVQDGLHLKISPTE